VVLMKATFLLADTHEVDNRVRIIIFLVFCIDYPRNSSALSPPLFLGAIPVLDAVFASFDDDNSHGDVWPNSTIVTTETSGKDNGDPQLEPRGDDAAIESVREMGTANVTTADDAPTGDMKGKQEKVRKVLICKKWPTKNWEKSSVTKPRQRRAVESSDDKEFVANDASNDASDDTKAIRGDDRATEGRKQGLMTVNPMMEKRKEGRKLSTMAISPTVDRSDRRKKL
jgi:hypothetical protein